LSFLPSCRHPVLSLSVCGSTGSTQSSDSRTLAPSCLLVSDDVAMAVCIQGDLSFWNKRRSFHGFSPLGFEGQPSIAKRPRLAPSEESAQPPSPSTLDAASSTPVATAAAAAAATASIANTAFSATVAAATEKKLPEGVQVGIVHRVKPDGGSLA